MANPSKWEVIACPHCSTRVAPMSNGQCPACRHYITGGPPATQDAEPSTTGAQPPPTDELDIESVEFSLAWVFSIAFVLGGIYVSMFILRPISRLLILVGLKKNLIAAEKSDDVMLVVFAAISLMTAYNYVAMVLRKKLHGQQPCERWFAIIMGGAGGAAVIACWKGIDMFFPGLFFCGGISYVTSRSLWRAFQSPTTEKDYVEDKVLGSDSGTLWSRLVECFTSFNPRPRLKATGILPWTLFVTVILTSMIPALAAILRAELLD